MSKISPAASFVFYRPVLPNFLISPIYSIMLNKSPDLHRSRCGVQYNVVLAETPF
jgi:hypothetical protein